MLEVYLEMQCGNIENCKKLIKKDTPQFAYWNKYVFLK
jgi:hypothetical protein